MSTTHALNLMWWSICLMCASVGFVGGVLKSSYDREQERYREECRDTRSIDQRVHDLVIKLGEQRRKNAALHGEDQ